jgi:cysteine desulfurase
MGIYLDYQATSPMPDEVKQAYLEGLQVVGNPSSIHQVGQTARAKLEDARERIAQVIDAEPVEVVFTSGGTEAINTVLKGALWAARRSGIVAPGIIASAAEHHATLDALRWLVEREGLVWHQPRVDQWGVLDTEQVSELLQSHPVALVSTLLANNEVGSITPVLDVVERSHAQSVPVHIDAIAALGYIPVSFRALGVTAMSISAHKVGGPVGVGALVVSRHAPAWESLHHGGDQQRMRSGTLDVAGALAFATALELRENTRVQQSGILAERRDRLRAGLLSVSPGIVYRGHPENRLPGNLHITVPGCEGDVLLYLLDERGIQVSTGSACQAGVPEASHVLIAMGVNESEARGALRFSLGYSTTDEDVDRVIHVFGEVVALAQRAGLAAG